MKGEVDKYDASISERAGQIEILNADQIDRRKELLGVAYRLMKRPEYIDAMREMLGLKTGNDQKLFRIQTENEVLAMSADAFLELKNRVDAEKKNQMSQEIPTLEMPWWVWRY